MPHHKLNIDAVTSVDYKTLKVTSTAFLEGAIIPTKYTYDGENVNPPLNIKGAPEDTQCLVIIMEDLDAPIRIWKHWLAWNIHSISKIKEGRIMEAEGINDFGENKYNGPCPYSGMHRYCFKVYALKEILNLPTTSTTRELERAMSEHIIAFGELMGMYKRA